MPPPRGRNGWDDPVTGPDDLAAEMLNLDPYGARFGKKRHGIDEFQTLVLDYMVDTTDGWSDATVNLDNAQLFWLNNGQDLASGTPSDALYVLTPSYVFVVWSGNGIQLTPPLTYSTAAEDASLMMAVAINGKIVIAGNSSVNRLGIYRDPLDVVGGAEPYPMGIKMPGAAPARANQGAGGAYTSTTLRYYRVSWAYQISSTTVLRSNLGVRELHAVRHGRCCPTDTADRPVGGTDYALGNLGLARRRGVLQARHRRHRDNDLRRHRRRHRSGLRGRGLGATGRREYAVPVGQVSSGRVQPNCRVRPVGNVGRRFPADAGRVSVFLSGARRVVLQGRRDLPHVHR
jgi:hypothetical protein